jgi:hypothetical protein
MTYPMSEQLRRAAVRSGLGCMALSRAVGIDPGAMCRFLKGRVGLKLANADKLAAALGLELVARRGHRKGGGT